MQMGFNADNEGGRSTFSANLKNLRKKADLTQLSLDYKHNTGTFGYSMLHNDKLFLPGKL